MFDTELTRKPTIIQKFPFTLQCSICYSNVHDPHTWNDNWPEYSNTLYCAVNYIFFLKKIQAVTLCHNSFGVILVMRDLSLDTHFFKLGCILANIIFKKTTCSSKDKNYHARSFSAEATTTLESTHNSSLLITARNTSSHPPIITGSGMVWTEWRQK